MRKKVQFTCIGLLILSGSCVSAKEIPTLVVSAGPEDSTYSHMLKDLQKVCKHVAHLKKVIVSSNIVGLTPYSYGLSEEKTDYVDLAFDTYSSFIIHKRMKPSKKGQKEEVEVLLPLNREEFLFLIKKNKEMSFKEIKRLGMLNRGFGHIKILDHVMNKNYKKYDLKIKSLL